MLAMVMKEFRQLRRDRRTVALLLFMPVLLLTVFGYAASFDVSDVPTVVFGPRAEQAASRLPEQVDVIDIRPDADREDAQDVLRAGDASLAVLTGRPPTALIDGSDLFAARALASGLPDAVNREVLFNEDLETPPVMVPGLIGLILLFIGTVATSLGVVRERQTGTLEQLAVMPLQPRDVFIGKVAPYLLIAILDTVLVVAAGLLLFDVPFRGDILAFAIGALGFLFATLGIGVLISSVSQNQGQAIQLALMTLLPQVLLSGLIFPVRSMAEGVRWIAYFLPLTYFIEVARGVMLRGAGLLDLLQPLGVILAMGIVVFAGAVLRFRADLAPHRGSRRQTERVEAAA